MSTSSTKPPSQLSTLDVLGVGICIEMLQQNQIWEAIEQNPNGSIMPADAFEYPATQEAKRLALEKRSASALGLAAKKFVEQWPIPSVSVWPYRRKPGLGSEDPGEAAEYFNSRVSIVKLFAEMHAHEIAPVGVFALDEPEEILERAFQFFDGNPEVPALLLFATDGDMARMKSGDVSRKPHWSDGARRFDSMCESVVTLILARRDRVDMLHQHVRQRINGAPNSDFKPSKFLPKLWTEEQIVQFDALPTIAVLHRPARVSYRKDTDGNPTFDASQKSSLMHDQDRAAAMKAAIEALSRLIPDKKPARIFYDTAGPETGRHVVPLSLALNELMPEFDLFDAARGIDISQRIGNTGAASPLVQWALAALAAQSGKDISVTANLRQNEEATLTLVTPPTPAPVAAKPVAKPAPTASMPAYRPPPPRTIALGTSFSSGMECAQTGVWQCDPPDSEAGATHFILAGRIFPPVNVARNLTAWQRVRGEPSLEKTATKWTLISYDAPAA